DVVRMGNEPRVYAEGILKVCELYLESPLSCVAGVTGANLKRRLVAIMATRVSLDLNFAQKSALVVFASVALSLPIIFGAMNAPTIYAFANAPEFDVASIKPIKEEFGAKQVPMAFASRGGRVQFTPAGVSGTRVTAKRIVMEAYGLHEYQVSGGPRWFNSDK